MLSERDLGRVACVGQRQHLAVDEQGVAADLDGAIAAAVDGVVLDLAGQVLSVVGRVDELRLDLRIPHGTPGDLASGAGQLVVQAALDTTELSR